jgi:hypothetical protein
MFPGIGSSRSPFRAASHFGGLVQPPKMPIGARSEFNRSCVPGPQSRQRSSRHQIHVLCPDMARPNRRAQHNTFRAHLDTPGPIPRPIPRPIPGPRLGRRPRRRSRRLPPASLKVGQALHHTQHLLCARNVSDAAGQCPESPRIAYRHQACSRVCVRTLMVLCTSP